MRRVALGTAVVLAFVALAALLARGGVLGEQAEHLLKDENAVRAPSGEFVPSGPQAPAVVWAVGDADDGPAAQRLAATIARDGADRVLYLGDVYEAGTAASFRAWAKVWGRFADRTAPTPGNHEWPEAEEGYDPYWRSVTGREPPSYYSFTVGGWEVLSLNSEATDAVPEQERWLAATVARRAGDCRIAFWHRPRFSAGPRGDAPALAPFWRDLRGAARMVVSGHEHNLQRLRARDGIVQLVVGAGGRGSAPLNARDERLAFADTRHAGAVRMVVREGSLSWRFVSADGAVLDAGTLRCSPSAA